MKTRIILYFLFVSLFCPVRAQDQSADGESDAGLMSSIHIPLLGNNRAVQVKEIPLIWYGSNLGRLVQRMCEPVYAPSIEDKDRGRDRNLLSRLHMKMSIEPLSDKSEYELVIDVSNCSNAADLGITVDDAIRAALICVRLEFPPGGLRKTMVRIKDDKAPASRWKEFNFPLWDDGGAH